ncbi:MAG: L-threonylcarbamoyladenylate synthase [Elusimicrobia bacterium]|nr:L-threonylcarbamoyladenylate synthase [Elusimicrobiota bacterium]
MIEYVIAQNPDDRILKRASRILSDGGLVSFPTDTNWVVAADPSSKPGVEKLYRFKHAQADKHFSVLCDGISRASEIAEIGDGAFRALRGRVPGNFTFIFKARKAIRKKLTASKRDHEIGIRFPPSILVQRLVAFHGRGLLSSNISHQVLGLEDQEMPIYGYLIEDTLSHKIDMVLDPGEFEFAGGSTIVSLLDEGAPVIIRQGAGQWEQ